MPLRIYSLALVLFTLLGLGSPAWALITGGEGNEPLNDPGWPIGGAAIFNHESRIAWWEGPPLGGGQWHAEYRGDAAALSKILADFAKLDVKDKRVVLHDGVGASFWLNTNRDPEKAAAAQADWIFVVWQPANWERLRKLPPDLLPVKAAEETSPPSQIDVYTGGKLRWSDVKVPKELTIVDERLEAHGYKATDGIVLEGKVLALDTKQPLAAEVVCELIEPKKEGGGYDYKVVKKIATDAQGVWAIKGAPAGQFRLFAQAKGMVPRVIGYGRNDSQPRWQSFGIIELTKPATVQGLVLDEAGKPLSDVEVRLSNVVAKGVRYDSPQEYNAKSDAQGKFVVENVPVGDASIWLHKPGYVRPGLGTSVSIPSGEVKVAMLKAASVKVVVGFGAATPPAGYIVHIIPEGGEAVGKWSGSGNIDAQHRTTFKDMPPGKYTLYGRPNPGSDSEQTDAIELDLKGGETREVVLTAK